MKGHFSDVFRELVPGGSGELVMLLRADEEAEEAEETKAGQGGQGAPGDAADAAGEGEMNETKGKWSRG